jgi:hypothetical protein
MDLWLRGIKLTYRKAYYIILIWQLKPIGKKNIRNSITSLKK